MIEVLWHGRGGQGAFTAAKLLGAAYSLSNLRNYALSFPSFGAERRGAPILAFTKLDTKKISDRSQIKKADYVVFLDDTLFTDESINEVKDNGKIFINSKKKFDDVRIISFDADSLALSILKMPVTNTVMLSILVKYSGLVSEGSLKESIRLYMNPKLYEKNSLIIDEVFKAVEIKHEF